MAKRHPKQIANQFKPGNPGGVINETTRARRLYRRAFDVLINADKPATEVIKPQPKDTLAQRLAKETLRDALVGEGPDKTAARRQIMDLFANRPAQGVYASDEDGNEKKPPEDLAAIVARLVGLGVTLPPKLTPRVAPKEDT